jgi:hypothetical protein
MSEILTKKQAIEFLNIDDKTFDNYFKNAGEFKSQDRNGARGRFMFDKAVLQQWMDEFNWRTVVLDLNDYAQCLDFALAQHFRGYVLSDWGTGRQREFGQKINNWIRGQLAEVAVRKFFLNEFGADVKLDFDIHDDIVPQDIIGVKDKANFREPKIGIGIKASKPKSSYLVLGENEITISGRRSDYYIFCRPDMPDDHLLRIARDKVINIVKNQHHFKKYQNDIPAFDNMTCEIAGWCSIKELEKVNGIPGQDFDGIRYVKKSGLLHKDRASWKELINKL